MGTQRLNGGRVGSSYDTAIVIKIPDARALHVVSRSLMLAMALVALPFMGSIPKGSVVSEFDATAASRSIIISAEVLSLIQRDLCEEGLLKKDDKVLIVGSPRVMEFDGSYDFVFIHSFEDAVFADGILRLNGIVAFPLSIDESNTDEFVKRPNYKVVYVRRYGAVVVALRKIGLVSDLVDSSPKRVHQLATHVKARQANKIEYLPELLGDSLEGYKRRL